MPPSQPAPGLSMLQPGCACPTWATVGAEVLSGALSIQQRSGDETQLEGHLGSVPAAASWGHLHTSSARSQGRVLGQLAAGHGGSGKLPTETDGRLLAGVRGSSETPRRAPASWGGPGAGSTDNEIPDLRHVDCARQSDSGLPLARGQAGVSGCPPRCRHREGAPGPGMRAAARGQPRLAVELPGALGQSGGAAVPAQGRLRPGPEVSATPATHLPFPWGPHDPGQALAAGPAFPALPSTRCAESLPALFVRTVPRGLRS